MQLIGEVFQITRGLRPTFFCGVGDGFLDVLLGHDCSRREFLPAFVEVDIVDAVCGAAKSIVVFLGGGRLIPP